MAYKKARILTKFFALLFFLLILPPTNFCLSVFSPFPSSATFDLYSELAALDAKVERAEKRVFLAFLKKALLGQITNDTANSRKHRLFLLAIECMDDPLACIVKARNTGEPANKFHFDFNSLLASQEGFIVIEQRLTAFFRNRPSAEITIKSSPEVDAMLNELPQQLNAQWIALLDKGCATAGWPLQNKFKCGYAHSYYLKNDKILGNIIQQEVLANVNLTKLSNKKSIALFCKTKMTDPYAEPSDRLLGKYDLMSSKLPYFWKLEDPDDVTNKSLADILELSKEEFEMFIEQDTNLHAANGKLNQAFNKALAKRREFAKTNEDKLAFNKALQNFKNDAVILGHDVLQGIDPLDESDRGIMYKLRFVPAACSILSIVIAVSFTISQNKKFQYCMRKIKRFLRRTKSPEQAPRDGTPQPSCQNQPKPQKQPKKRS